MLLQHEISKEIATLDEWRGIFKAMLATGLVYEDEQAYYWSFLRPVRVL